MKFTFVNREQELKELDSLSKKRGLAIIYGRRRVGKTRLIAHWLKATGGLYSMAIEGSKINQLKQIYIDIKDSLDIQIEPTSWEELFSILDNQKLPINLCIDEFPYLVDSDPSLPSRFQKWIDHKKNDNLFLILSGSSQTMMHNIFLSNKSPLFGRAIKIIQIKPLNYSHFCKLLKFDPYHKDSFITFSLIGGIPKYWEYIDNMADPIENANNLYFSFSPYMENEPHRILRDEKIEGIVPLDILESDAWPGMQVKVMYKPQIDLIDELVNIDEQGVQMVASGAFIFDLSKGGVDEKTGKVEIGLNNLLKSGSQILLEGSWTNIESATEQKSGGSLMLFVGADIL